MRYCVILAFILTGSLGFGEAAEIVVRGPEKSANDFSTYTLNSPYQGRPAAIEVLVPDKMTVGQRYPVLYLLPVNDGIMNQWGSGIVEARRQDIHNRFNVICVSPEYDYTPWYGNHPSDPALAQENYLIKAVIPMIEERFPVIGGPDGRILLGFSKSGFGAMSIALRNLDFIGKAAVWDAPLTMKKYFPGEEEMVRVFETQENFAKYCIPTLIDKHLMALQNGPSRFVLVSNANPNDSVTSLHTLFEKDGIPHRYALDKRREHTWTSEWLPVVANLLFADDPNHAGKQRP
jgi:hypothetical protein